MVSFDVSSDVEAEGDDGGTPVAADARAGWWSRAGDRWRRADRRQRRLLAGAAGGVVLVLIGGTAVAAVVVSHTHDERLRSAPGGVLSLTGEVGEVWRAEGNGVLAVLPGGGVVLDEDEDVVARDAGSGQERWRANLGADPVCGPRPRLESGVEWSMPSDLVTCLHGPAEERTVTVLDAAGDVVGHRELPAAEYGGEDRDVAPAADGGLLVANHDTDMPDDRRYATQEDARAALRDVEPGRASVRVEDAVTGDLRFEVPTTAHAGRLLDECAFVWDESEAVGLDTFDRSAPYRLEVSPERRLHSSPAVVGYRWCDVGGATTPDGRSFAEHAGGGAQRGGGEVVPYPGGGHVMPTASGPDGSVLLAADGTVRLESSRSTISVPHAAVDARGPVVVATAGYQAIAGLDLDGEELWRHDLMDPHVLAQVGEALVVAGQSDVVALDVADGSELWRVALYDPQELYGWPTSAVTDGERVMVALIGYEDDVEVGELLTMDLATGAADRERLDAGRVPYLSAVDGHVVLQEVGRADAMGVYRSDVTSVSILAPR